MASKDNDASSSTGDEARALSARRYALQAGMQSAQRGQMCTDGHLKAMLQHRACAKQRQAKQLSEWLDRRPRRTRPLSASRADPASVETASASVPTKTGEQPKHTEAADAKSEGMARGEVAADVMERRDVTDDLKVFRIAPARPLSFKPGQYVKLGVDGITRNYSIVSAPHEPALEFFIELVPGGEMSERLRRLQAGSRVTLGSRAKGNLLLDPRYPNQVMVATTTGIAPFVSMLRGAVHQGLSQQRFWIFHGCRYQDEFGYDAQLRSFAERHPEYIRYIAAVSRPQDARNSGWSGETGRIDAVLDRYFSAHDFDTQATVMYACGNPDMVRAVESRYTTKDFVVEVERYWKR